MFEFQVGDILLTRNAGGESENRSPGWYNHAAIVTKQGIVEAQMHVRHGQWTNDTTAPGAVILSDPQEFWDRYPIILVRRLDQHEIAEQVARRAEAMVDTMYRRLASMFRILRRKERGLNCVAVVRGAVSDTVGYDPNWKTPDHIAASRLLYTVHEKWADGGTP